MTAFDYVNVGKPVRLDALHCKPPFSGYSVLQIFCNKVEPADAILSVAKNNWNGNFYM